MELTRWQRLRTKAFLFAMGIKRRMTLGVRVVLIEDGKVYLIRHTYMPGWQFPGGGVEPGETAQESGIREVIEETGRVAHGPLELFGFYHNVSSASNRDHVALYLCHNSSQAHEFKPNFEIAEFGWFALDALPPTISPGTARRIAEIFHGAQRSGTW